MSNKVTVDEIEQSVKDNNLSEFHFRDCSVCNAPLSYIFENGEVFFNSNCYCVNYTAPLQKRSYADIANLINIQIDEGIVETFKQRLMLK